MGEGVLMLALPGRVGARGRGETFFSARTSPYAFVGRI